MLLKLRHSCLLSLRVTNFLGLYGATGFLGSRAFSTNTRIAMGKPGRLVTLWAEVKSESKMLLLQLIWGAVFWEMKRGRLRVVNYILILHFSSSNLERNLHAQFTSQSINDFLGAVVKILYERLSSLTGDLGTLNRAIPSILLFPSLVISSSYWHLTLSLHYYSYLHFNGLRA